MPQNRRLQKTYIVNILVINLVCLTFLGSVWVLQEYWQYNNEVTSLRKEFIESQKVVIRNEVENAIIYIDNINKDAEKDLKTHLKARSNQIFAIIEGFRKKIDLNNKNEARKELKRILTEINTNSLNNYLFFFTEDKIEDINSDIHPRSFFPGDSKNYLNLREQLEIVKSQGESFYRHSIVSGNQSQPIEIVLNLRYYAPLNLIIGVGMDYNQYISERQRDVILRLAHIRFGKKRDGYLFANFQNADPLLTNGIITMGQPNKWDLEDPNGIRIMQEEYKAAQKPHGDFIQYSWRKIFTQEEKAYGIEKPTSPKISFIKGYKPWNWMVGAGFYIDDIDLVILNKRNELYSIIRNHIIVISSAYIISVLLTLLSIRIIQKRLNSSYNRFINFFTEASSGKAQIDTDQLYYKEFKDLAAHANRMVQQREQAEEGFRQIVELFPFPIIIYKNNSVLYLNSEWIKLIGYTIKEVPTLDRAIIKCFGKKNERIILQNIRDSIQLNSSDYQNILFKISCKDGMTRYMKLNYILLKDNNAMLTLEDYTQRKKVEDDLNAARLKAEASDRLKSAFLANMSHEIRTPMNAIVGFSGLLMNENLGKEKRNRYVKLINRSSDTLLNLINDILDISSIEAGQMSYNISKGNLFETFNQIDAEIKSIRSTISKEHVDINLRCEITDEQSAIETDFLRFKQVMMNLLSNALKFTSEGYIEYGCRFRKKGLIEFYVRDTGIGIKEVHLKEIFNRFTKVEEDSAIIFRGAGLGLSISKKIVEHLGGNIHVNSVYGEGSTFWFTLPCKISKAKFVAEKEKKTSEEG